MLRAGAIRAGQSPPARDAERHLTDVTSQSIIYTLYDVVQKMRLWRPYLPHHSLDPSGDPDFHAAEDEHLSDSHGSRRTSAPSLASRASTFSQVSDIRRRCVCTSTDPGLPLAPPLRRQEIIIHRGRASVALMEVLGVRPLLALQDNFTGAKKARL